MTVQDSYDTGYIFICPYRATQTGPYIFDKAGNLVWSGYNVTEQNEEAQINTHELRICAYQGSDHLCMWKVRLTYLYSSPTSPKCWEACPFFCP